MMGDERDGVPTLGSLCLLQLALGSPPYKTSLQDGEAGMGEGGFVEEIAAGSEISRAQPHIQQGVLTLRRWYADGLRKWYRSGDGGRLPKMALRTPSWFRRNSGGVRVAGDLEE